MELIQQREMKLNHTFRDAQRQQSLETSRADRLTLRNRDVRTADDNEYKGTGHVLVTYVIATVDRKVLLEWGGGKRSMQGRRQVKKCGVDTHG